jgi:hypothetical protein
VTRQELAPEVIGVAVEEEVKVSEVAWQSWKLRGKLREEAAARRFKHVIAPGLTLAGIAIASYIYLVR